MRLEKELLGDLFKKHKMGGKNFAVEALTIELDAVAQAVQPGLL